MLTIFFYQRISANGSAMIFVYYGMEFIHAYCDTKTTFFNPEEVASEETKEWGCNLLEAVSKVLVKLNADICLMLRVLDIEFNFINWNSIVQFKFQ